MISLERFIIVLICAMSLSVTTGASAERPDIEKYFTILQNEETSDREKIEASSKLTDELTSYLKEDEKTFARSFEGQNWIGRTISNDNKLCMYTWGFPLSDKSYHYGCVYQYKKSRKVYTNKLTIKSIAYKPAENAKITRDNWYGSLYYRIINVKYKKDEYYTLIGWSGISATSHMKVIDAARVDSKGRMTLAKLAFKKIGKQPQNRTVLEYRSDLKINVNYDDMLGAIVFDHLVPESTMFTDLYSYYGPDFTYDGYFLINGRWMLRENVDAKNKD